MVEVVSACVLQSVDYEFLSIAVQTIIFLWNITDYIFTDVCIYNANVSVFNNIFVKLLCSYVLVLPRIFGMNVITVPDGVEWATFVCVCVKKNLSAEESLTEPLQLKANWTANKL